MAACGGPEMDPRDQATEGMAQQVANSARKTLDEQQRVNQGGSDVYTDPGQVTAYVCDPYYNDPYCECPYYDPYCEGLPPPPPPPPAQPQYMTYTPFSESSSMTVSWKPVYDATYYQLERFQNGYWSNVYTGGAASVNLGVYAEGVLTYRVQACNDGGCSDFLTDNEMRFSSGPSRGTASGMSVEAQNFLSALGFETPATLGIGYDHLRQEVTKNTCLDTTASTNSWVDARVKDFKLDMAYSRDELSTLLSLTQNMGVSAKYGKFSGSYSGKKEMLSTSTRVEETYMVVASLRDQFRVQTLDNSSSLPLTSTHLGLLQSNQGATFRNRCGDAYVYQIAHGRQFYITFQLRSFNHTRDEIRTQTNNLKVDIGTYVSASYDSTKKTQITQKYSGYSVQAHVISYGSSVGVTGVVSLDAALQFMKDFEAEPVSNGSYPIDFKTSDYERPAGVNFPAYQNYKNILHRWYSFDQQVAQRCEMFDDNLYGEKAINMTGESVFVGAAGGRNLRSDCFFMKRAVQENIQNCEDTTKWGSCVHPDSASCFVPGTGESCLSFANRFPYWTSAPSTLRLSGSLGSGLSADSRTVSASTCLSGQQIRDLRTGSVDCAGQGGCPYVREGVTVWASNLHRASNGTNSWNASSKCLNASVTIRRPSWWGGTAHVEQNQTINGLNPQSLNYLF
jgi:hypothetical protein